MAPLRPVCAVLNVAQSMMTGRPPVIQREYIDCKFPTPVFAPDGEEGEEQEEACKHRPFCRALFLEPCLT